MRVTWPFIRFRISEIKKKEKEIPMKKNTKRILSLLMTVVMVIGMFSASMIAVNAAHEHIYFTRVIQATCTEKGYTYHVCACGANFSDNEVPALGHDMKKTASVEAN